ncbi:hypothetical protein JXD38_08455 [candidate division WOR-3 bacterium]|nr:hypothetical protein [candidate division WOR-3 bacterium]
MVRWFSGIGVLLLVCSLASAYSLYDPPRIVPRVDYSLGLVFLERWRGDYLIGVERVLPISEYLDYQLAQSVRDAWQDEAQRNREKQELAADASGLIPDIQLPKLPLFGEGSKIDISGKDRITLGGRQTFVHGTAQSQGSRSLFPELKMEQQLSVILNGTIGERTKVNIDHDSERQESQNKVMLSYTGTEDEIIQSVELGDTRLTIPGTGYTGDLPAHHGLFGASARGKVGGVDVYAIASREQSQSQTRSFAGKSQVSTDTIYECDYVSRKFYYVDAPGTITNLRVYVDDRNPSNNQSAYRAIATMFPDAPEWVPDTARGEWTYDRAPGDFDLKVLGKDYVLGTGNVIEFAKSLDQSDVVGLVIVTSDTTIGGNREDTLDPLNDTVMLKLLKPEITDRHSFTWDYERRNYYQLPLTGITLTSASLQYNTGQGSPVIETDTAGANKGRKLLEILGLDPNRDGLLAYPEFDGSTGLIRFPGTRPFDSSALSVRDSLIYQVDPATLTRGEGRSYRMIIEYSSATESYSLGQPDITENSEKVRVDGQLWSSGTDYTIDYTAGVVSFIRPLPPDADIQITYEYNPLFSVSQKSLVGGRAEWSASQQGKLGTSVFYRSENTQDEKPSLGSEPFSRVIAETDASYAVTSDAVSALLDRLPLLRAQAPSSFGVSAEGAVSMPNPNTRGAAYLDDFEGTTITRDVSLVPVLWSWSSVPVGKDTAHLAHTRLAWVKPTVGVRNDSVFGATEEGDRDRHDILKVAFTPDPDDPGSWAGMMTSAAQSGMSMNLSDVEDLRMILKTRDATGTIHVTVGMSIDEDAPRRNRGGAIVGLNGRNDTEDKDVNGVLSDGEDTGLDGVFGDDSQWGPDSADDGNDDYDTDTNPQGTEGNKYLDQEDLDRSGFSRYNHYFECSIPLGDARYFSDLVNGWRLYRVSLQDSTVFKTVGQPKWEDIRLVRVWFDGFMTPDTIDFYSIEFIGSRWTDPTITSLRDTGRMPGRVPTDTSEKVWATQVSRKTDTSYTSPFQLKRDASGNLESEAALLFGYRDLKGFRRATVDKAVADLEDYREYGELRMYVHDDGNGLAFLLRLGADSANYYEYRAPVTSGKLVPGRDGKWYEFVIPLDSFPVLKLRRGEADVPVTNLWSSGPYRMLGTPSLADVRYTALGIENPGSSKVSGGLWFDDMRLTVPHKEAGYGFQANSSVALSDFASASVSFNYSDPNFRRFSEGRGVKAGGFGTSVGASVRANLDRLLPQSWGLVLPVGYSISDQRSVPKFSPLYPDLLLPKALASSAEYLTRGRSEELSLDNIHKQRSNSRWLNYTLEGMALSWRNRRGLTRAALSGDSSSASTVQWSYGVAPDLKMKIGSDNELALFPQNIRMGLTNARQRSLRGTRISPDSLFRYDTLQGNGLATELAIDYSPIEDLTFGYDVQTERDLLVPSPESLWLVNVGTQAGREYSFDAGYNFEIADAITPGVDFNGDYSDDRVKVDTGYSAYRNMNNSGDLEFTLGLDLPELLGSVAPAERKSPKSRAAKPEPEPMVDSLVRDSLAAGDTAGNVSPPKPSPFEALQRGAGSLSRALEPVDVSYTFSRNSDLIGVYEASPWQYRLGFTDMFTFDSLNKPTSATREHRNTLRVSTGGQVRELTARIAYQMSEGQDLSSILTSTTLDRSTTWPDLDLTLGKVHALFRNWATDSKLSASYRHQQDLSGRFVRYYEPTNGDSVARESLGMYGRTETNQHELSPLVSWSTTWKKRVSTTLSANYTFGSTVSFLDDSGVSRSVTYSNTRGMNLSLSYTFSAPQGLRLPLLGKLKFSSDLSLTWSLRMSRNHRWQQRWVGDVQADSISELQDDNSFGTSVAASYRFSRSIEAGLSTEYSQTRPLSVTTTESMGLDIWVLFRF